MAICVHFPLEMFVANDLYGAPFQETIVKVLALRIAYYGQVVWFI